MGTTLQLLALCTGLIVVRASLTHISRRLDTMSELLQMLNAQVATQAEKIAALQMSIDNKQEAIAASLAALEAALDEESDPTALQELLDMLKANNGQIDAAAADIAATPLPDVIVAPV